MKNLFRRLRLITPISLKFPLSPDQFVQRLQPHVAPAYTNPFGRLGRIFSPTVAPYTGAVKADAIRMKPRAGDNWAFTPFFQATLLPETSGMRLEGELNGVSLFVIVPAIFCLLVVLFELFILFSRPAPIDLLTVIVLLLSLLVKGVMFIGLPYFLTRRSMQKTAYELERDLFYFVERPAQTPVR